MTITAAFHFELRGLHIRRELLGARIEVPGEPRRWLEFPADEEAWGIAASPSGEIVISGWSGTVDDPKQEAIVNVLRVTVEIDSEMTSADFSSGGLPVLEESSRLLKSAVHEARRALSRLLAWVRVSGGQYWLEPQQTPPRLTWITEVLDGAGERIHSGYSDPFKVDFRGNETAISMEQVVGALRCELEPPLAAELLADAKFYAWGASEPSSRMALMLAAVAVEVRIKTHLAERATSEQSLLVQLILTSPRDFSVAAAALYDKALHAVTHRSLRADEPPLYKAVVALFEERNKFAHRGQSGELDPAALRVHLATADAAFAYLDSLA